MPIGAAVGAGIGSLGAGYFGYKASNKAAEMQARGQAAAAEAQAQAQHAALEMYRPFVDQGRGAMTTLSRLYGIDASGNPTGQAFNQDSVNAFRNTPGYQFSQNEGEHSILNAASRFGVNNSNTLRNLSQFNVGNADSTFRQSYVQPLLSLAGIGGQAANGAAGALTNTANAQAGALTGAATAQASGIVGGFNALGLGLQGAGSAATNYATTSSILGALNRGAYGQQGGGGAWSPQQFDQAWHHATPSSFSTGGNGGIGSM